jgi:hypothetical protein
MSSTITPRSENRAKPIHLNGQADHGLRPAGGYREQGTPAWKYHLPNYRETETTLS